MIGWLEIFVIDESISFSKSYEPIAIAAVCLSLGVCQSNMGMVSGQTIGRYPIYTDFFIAVELSTYGKALCQIFSHRYEQIGENRKVSEKCRMCYS